MTAGSGAANAGAHPHSAPVAGRVLLFATLGYLYIGLVLAAIVAATVLMVRVGAGGLALVPAGLLLLILFSLWVNIAVPEGRRLSRDEAPRLFRAIDRARAQLRAPEADVVILSGDLNAAVLERPRFGAFGPRVRYLVVGLPLLHAMPEQEVRATLAHEFAHLSRQHNRAHLWLVRVAATLHALVMALQASNHWGRFLFIPFFRWYTPRLEMLTQAASRAHEYESDRLAARAVGAQVMGRSLLRLAVQTVMLDREVMPEILRSSLQHASPPPDAFASMLRGVQRRPDPAALSQALGSVLRERSREAHSHPSLSERLESLNLSTDPAALRAELATDEPPAVDALLDADVVSRVTDELGQAWHAAATPGWEALHTDARVWREAGLNDPAAAANAGRAALLAHARWGFHCQPPARSIPLLRRVLEHAPDEPEAAALLGRLLVREDDAAAQAEGVALLEEQAARSSVHAPGAVEALQEHYARAADDDALRRLGARDLALRDELLRGLHDRHRLLHGDTFRPYPLPPAAREALVRALEEQPAVQQAFLLEKQTRLLADSPVVVLALYLKVPFHRYSSGSLATRVCEALLPHLHLPEMRDYLVATVGARSRLLRRLRGTPGAEVYRRGEPLPEPSAPGEWRAPRRLPRRALAAGGLVAALLVAGIVFAVTREDPGRDERRLAGLRKAVQEAPASAGANRRLAEELARQDRWAEAEGPLERVAALEPDAWVYNALGWARMQKGEFGEALGPLRRAIALEPEHPHAVRNLGWTLFNLDSLDHAEQVYRRAVRIHPGDAGTRGELAAVLTAMRRLGEAEAEFSWAVKRAPENAWLIHGLGITQLQLGRLADAEANLRRAAALAPRDVVIWADLGHLEHLNGDYAESAAAFQRAYELDPTYFVNQPYRRGMWEASRAGRAYQPPPATTPFPNVNGPR